MINYWKAGVRKRGRMYDPGKLGLPLAFVPVLLRMQETGKGSGLTSGRFAARL